MLPSSSRCHLLPLHFFLFVCSSNGGDREVANDEGSDQFHHGVDPAVDQEHQSSVGRSRRKAGKPMAAKNRPTQ